MKKALLILGILVVIVTGLAFGAVAHASSEDPAFGETLNAIVEITVTGMGEIGHLVGDGIDGVGKLAKHGIQGVVDLYEIYRG